MMLIFTHNFTARMSFEAFTIHVYLQNSFTDAFKFHLNEEFWCANSTGIWLLVNTMVPTLCKDTRNDSCGQLHLLHLRNNSFLPRPSKNFCPLFEAEMPSKLLPIDVTVFCHSKSKPAQWPLKTFKFDFYIGNLQSLLLKKRYNIYLFLQKNWVNL